MVGRAVLGDTLHEALNEVERAVAAGGAQRVALLDDEALELEGDLVGDEVVVAAEGLDEGGQDGHGGVALHRLDAARAPQAHADVEDGAADERDVGVRLPRLDELAEVEERRVAEVRRHEGLHRPPRHLAVVLHVHHAALSKGRAKVARNT